MSSAAETPAEQNGNSVAESFLLCLEKANHQTSPFDFWLLEDVLPEGLAAEIANLPFDPPSGIAFSGQRESNNATRIYFSEENQDRFEVCRKVADGFKSRAVIEAIERETGANLRNTRLRIEYCQDTQGFWLEPHTDIRVKKYTMLVYLADDPSLANAGTDIHEGPPDFKYVTSAPYARNKGVIFVPGENTWHAVGERPMKSVRKSIIINFVSDDWRDAWELA